MIICMSKIFCVTNRSFCKEDFFRRIQTIVSHQPDGIILREKDLSEAEYTVLAETVMQICQAYAVPCILHSFVNSAIQLHAERLHLPLPVLRKEKSKQFPVVGVSCHSAEEAEEAAAWGADYLIAGHIFTTDCKKGLPGRGTDFLKQICQTVDIPVYAIGGITSQNIPEVLASGAAGVCLMSEFMTCPDIAALMESLRKNG